MRCTSPSGHCIATKYSSRICSKFSKSGTNSDGHTCTLYKAVVRIYQPYLLTSRPWRVGRLARQVYLRWRVRKVRHIKTIVTEIENLNLFSKQERKKPELRCEFSRGVIFSADHSNMSRRRMCEIHYEANFKNSGWNKNLKRNKTSPLMPQMNISGRKSSEFERSRKHLVSNFYPTGGTIRQTAFHVFFIEVTEHDWEERILFPSQHWTRI